MTPSSRGVMSDPSWRARANSPSYLTAWTAAASQPPWGPTERARAISGGMDRQWQTRLPQRVHHGSRASGSASSQCRQTQFPRSPHPEQTGGQTSSANRLAAERLTFQAARTEALVISPHPAAIHDIDLASRIGRIRMTIPPARRRMERFGDRPWIRLAGILAL